MKRLLFVVMLISMTMMVQAAEKRRPKDCQSICTMHYDPVCAGGAGESPKSFGNICVMQNYNCENNKNLAVISQGECPNGGGIRLS
ncbi:Vasotab [Pseudolycoriella hygida]|uniref:Vasotab n=1 Tax=Pseudolycoriella hygida TaxID=35572 RepID=A0A9Q0N8X5_9DIPT|nr:Vasotab [Pseudolycoriella hygida]